jgi:hypothetical protein
MGRRHITAALLVRTKQWDLPRRVSSPTLTKKAAGVPIPGGPSEPRLEESFEEAAEDLEKE